MKVQGADRSKRRKLAMDALFVALFIQSILHTYMMLRVMLWHG